MNKKSNSRPLITRNKYLIVFGVVIFFLTIVSIIFANKPKPYSTPTIFLVDTPVTYGETQMDGILRQDSQFTYLVLDDSRLALVGSSKYVIKPTELNVPVTVRGYLGRAEDTDLVGIIFISSITNN